MSAKSSFPAAVIAWAERIVWRWLICTEAAMACARRLHTRWHQNDIDGQQASVCHPPGALAAAGHDFLEQPGL